MKKFWRNDKKKNKAITLIDNEIAKLLYAYDNIKNKSENISRVTKLIFALKILQEIKKKLDE